MRRREVDTDMASDIPESAYIIAQQCVKRGGPPVILLGSGASVEFGIPGMPELRQCLLESDPGEKLEDSEFSAQWKEFRDVLSPESSDVENALTKVSNPYVISNYVAESTWKLIAPKDTRAMEEITRGNRRPALSELVAHLSATSNRLFHVVTTNYDRIAEYAAEMANLCHYTGFTSGYRRCMDNKNLEHLTQKNICIWKIHGSIDWFSQSEGCGRVVSFPVWDELPASKWRPAIVPPGNLKYQQTHNEPYNTMLQKAKQAISEHSTILAIGFGFNESHIQEKLEAQCAKKGTVMVILAKKLSDNAKQLLDKSKCQYLAFEEYDLQQGVCLMRSHENPGKNVKIKGNFWQLSSFMSLITPKEATP